MRIRKIYRRITSDNKEVVVFEILRTSMTKDIQDKIDAIISAGTTSQAKNVELLARAEKAEADYKEIVTMLATVYAKLVSTTQPAENELAPPIVITKP